MGLLQKTEAVSYVQDENKSVLNKNQETSKQYEQKIAMYVTPICYRGVILQIWFCFFLTFVRNIYFDD